MNIAARPASATPYASCVEPGDDDVAPDLQQVVDDVVVERAKVEAAAATYLVYYRRHLALEDRDLVPRAEQLLTPQDWEAVMAANPAGPDPLFGEDSDPRYRELRRQIALAAPEL